ESYRGGQPTPIGGGDASAAPAPRRSGRVRRPTTRARSCRWPRTEGVVPLAGMAEPFEAATLHVGLDALGSLPRFLGSVEVPGVLAARHLLDGVLQAEYPLAI